MKLLQFSILTVLMLVVGNVFSQTDSTITYRLQHFLPDTAFYYSCENSLVRTVCGDTIINGNKMHKVYNKTGFYDDEHYEAAIREDTLSGKLYVLYKDSEYEDPQKEVLLMDFSVEEGDTVILPRGKSYYGEMLVHVVDDIYYDEKGRKVIETITPEYNCVIDWIEGIGCVSNAIFPPVCGLCDAIWHPLIRMFVGDSVVYDFGSDCSVAIEEHNTLQEKCSIYPNPASSYLIVDLEQIDCLSYEIITPVGVVCQSLELSNTIDISDVPSGINHLIVRNGDGDILYFSKFIKK